jgi:hypothetical protein
MLWFKKKNNKQATDEFFKYLNISCADGEINAYGDITNEDIKRWLYGVTRAIQLSFGKHPEIKNYLMGQIWLGGQQVEFVLVKDFKEGPHAMRLKAEAEVERLKKEVERLTTASTGQQ